jgi:hypothetical protein
MTEIAVFIIAKAIFAHEDMGLSKIGLEKQRFSRCLQPDKNNHLHNSMLYI